MTLIERKMKQMGHRTSFALEDWVVEPEFNQLTQGVIHHRVEPKVMSVLLLLADRAQSVVSKEEILRTVWPDTFVGEDTLTRCISVLRAILKDDPHNPRFIKTVFKVGYCLLVESRPLEETPAELSRPIIGGIPQERRRHVVLPEAPVARQLPAAPQAAEQKAGRRAKIQIGAVLLAFAALAAIWIVHSIQPNSALPPISTFQLTTNAGEQSRPAFSPDGKRIAFVWAKEDGTPQHIYIKDIEGERGGEALLRLTDLPDSEYSPAWSPDGNRIAFLASSEAGRGLYVATLAPTPSVHKIYTPGETKRWEEGALSWSPDGRTFALVDHVGSQANSSIFLIDAESLHVRTLTTPPTDWEGDLNPVFSPAGTKIAFLRATEGWDGDLYWISAAGGELHQVTHDRMKINGIAWSLDNRSIVFSSNRAGQDALWKAALKGGPVQRLPVGTENATQPATSRDGSALAFVQGSAIFGVLRVTASASSSREIAPPVIVSSTAQDSAPSVSPDGSQFAFQSWRSGSRQIWVSSIDGRGLRQLTQLDGDISGPGSPSWSPDGGSVVFDARLNGHAHIFVVPTPGGNPKQVTFGNANDIVPRWSADGQCIYFRSNQGGRWQLWKLSLSNRVPIAVTNEDGMVGQESKDGKWLFYARDDEKGIWRMPASGGPSVRILDQPAAGYWGYWAVGPNGIYFLDQKQSIPSISVYDFATGKTSIHARLNHPPPTYSGLSLLGRDILISDKYDAGSHITIAKGKF